VSHAATVSQIVSITNHRRMSLEELFDEAKYKQQQTAVGRGSSEKVTSECGALTWHNSCAMQDWHCHNNDEMHGNELSFLGQGVS